MSQNNKARYVYCVAEVGEKISLGNIGLDDNEVYSIPYHDLCAMVHNCPAEPYSSDEEETVRQWAIGHQKVIETALKRFGTILPMAFDTIIQDTAEGSAEDNIQKWLAAEHDELKRKLDRVRDKEEYGIQISWEPKAIATAISRTDPDIQKLEAEISSKSKGLAYMYKQRLEKLLKQKVEKEAEHYFKDFYNRIKGCVNELKVERTKNQDDKQMLMNLSCLVPKGEVKLLAAELEKIDNMDGFSVRFTGPWPPYSFVTVK